MAQFDEITASSGKPAKLGQISRITRPIGKTNATGFTLVEVIASLLIVGILGAIAGMGLVTGMKGYMQAKENAHLAQKAQIALTRINRELIELEKVVDFPDEAPTNGSPLTHLVLGNRPLKRWAINCFCPVTF